MYKSEGFARYEAKGMADKTFGVYDYERGSFPVQTPELTAAGVGRLSPWYKSRAEAEAIAEALNKFHGTGQKVTKAMLDMSKAAKKANDSLGDMAAALIADQASGQAVSA